MTYPERGTGSRETGQFHTKYKFLLIRKQSLRLPVTLYQNTITMGGRRHIMKILGKPYQNSNTVSQMCEYKGPIEIKGG